MNNDWLIGLSGFLMMVGIIGELFGKVYSGPYYATLIVWYLGKFFQFVLGVFFIHIPNIMTRGELLILVTIVYVFVALWMMWLAVTSDKAATQREKT